eukprot:scaffold191383_cov41-Prasinocladus_malaysianus.AAC.5
MAGIVDGVNKNKRDDDDDDADDYKGEEATVATGRMPTINATNIVTMMMERTGRRIMAMNKI